jgi:hypothetical protein
MTWRAISARPYIGEYSVADAWTVESLFEACGEELKQSLKGQKIEKKIAAEKAAAAEK